MLIINILYHLKISFCIEFYKIFNFLLKQSKKSFFLNGEKGVSLLLFFFGKFSKMFPKIKNNVQK